MNKQEAKVMAENAIHEKLDGWQFRWNKGRRMTGCCHFLTKTIELSVHYVELNPAELIYQTLLHEIAHAIAGPDAGHGPRWRRAARELGYTGGRLNERATMPKGRYRVDCPRCGELGRLHRLTKKRRIGYELGEYSCRRCGELTKLTDTK